MTAKGAFFAMGREEGFLVASYVSDMERPVNLYEDQVLIFGWSALEATRAAVEAAVATVDQSDIRGSDRRVLIRRELPRTMNAD
jgi:hypothetical protein